MTLPLSSEEIERHKSLIIEYCKTNQGHSPEDILYLRNGARKGIYEVKLKPGTEFLAAAAARNQEEKLLGEYCKLIDLHEITPTLLPRPISHFTSTNGEDLYFMELLPHQDLDRFDKFEYEGSMFFHRLAYKIGESVGFFNAMTGHYPNEPHNGNILARSVEEGQDIEIKFCDADQLIEGNLDEAINALLIEKDQRPECYRFVHKLREGLMHGLKIAGKEVSEEEYLELTKLLNKYNPILEK